MKYTLHYNAHFIFISGWLIEIAWESIYTVRAPWRWKSILLAIKENSFFISKLIGHIQQCCLLNYCLPKVLFKNALLYLVYSQKNVKWLLNKRHHSFELGNSCSAHLQTISTFFVNVLNAGRRPSLKYFHTLVFTSLVTDFGAELHIMDQAFLTNSYFSHYELKKIYESSKIWRKLSKASRSDKWAAVFSKLRLA